jgi:hypothetical protein
MQKKSVTVRGVFHLQHVSWLYAIGIRSDKYMCMFLIMSPFTVAVIVAEKLKAVIRETLLLQQAVWTPK